MADRLTDEDEALLAELGVEPEAKKAKARTPREERIIAGFEEIQRFAQEHGRPPQHGEDRDIFERLYAVRLDRIRSSGECLDLLSELDDGGLLIAEPEAAEIESDDELLAALGVDAAADDDVTVMKYVRPHAERSSPDKVAQRTVCKEFDERFRSLFVEVQRQIASGERTTERFNKRDERRQINAGDWFVLDGQKVLVERAYDWEKLEHGRRDRRLRTIYDNGTESELLMRSLRRALNKDETSRRILPPEAVDDTELGPLFSDQPDDEDYPSGTIYVARSLSDHPFIAENRDVLHKIGVTGGDPRTRVVGAKKDPTFLLADAELVASFKLANLNRRKLERLLHRYFAEARMDLQLRDRFGGHVEPEEWFLVPLPEIKEAVELLIAKKLEKWRYDARAAKNVESGE
jgi:hypothetical protein